MNKFVLVATENKLDTVRILNTNKYFYLQMITLFLKFREGNAQDKFDSRDMTKEFT